MACICEAFPEKLCPGPSRRDNATCMKVTCTSAIGLIARILPFENYIKPLFLYGSCPSHSFLYCSISPHFSTCRTRSSLYGLKKAGLRHYTGVFSFYRPTRQTKIARSTTVLWGELGGHIRRGRIILHNNRLILETRSLSIRKNNATHGPAKHSRSSELPELGAGCCRRCDQRRLDA